MAYALIPDPKHPGMFYDVELKLVYAESMEFLESHARPSAVQWCLSRVMEALGRRKRRGEWT